MKVGWEFPFNNGGTSQGFNHGGIDTFAGNKLGSTVREVIQNSVDAKDPEIDAPAKVEFSYLEVPRSQVTHLDELATHLGECEKTAISYKDEVAKAFYQKALSLIRSKYEVPFLVISDSNTTGLEGELDEERGPWFALIKGSGITQKMAGSNGSFGHGSMAPFAIGGIRTIYYLTRISGADASYVDRFQGKSVLQSHRHPIKADSTQGVGFFGEKTGLRPLVSADIPDWALNLRRQHSNGKGTTLIVPFPFFCVDMFAAVKVTVVANFFYAIYLRNLEVIVNGEVINKGNVKEKYFESKQLFEEGRLEVNEDHIKACFQSIETVVSSDVKGSREIPKFGKIDWYLRVDEGISRRSVGIARESGMLITRRPPQLERFPQTKNFDLFLFVNAGPGSNMMRRLENPAHDKFEFDRVHNAEDEKRIRALYKEFCMSVREIIKEHAALDSDSEVSVSELSQVLSGLDSEKDSTGNIERGDSMFISLSPVQRNKYWKQGKLGASGTQIASGSRDPKSKGEGSKARNSHADEWGDGGREISVKAGLENIISNASKVSVENIRISRVRNDPMRAKIYFSTMLTGTFSFSLFKAIEGSADKASQAVLLQRDGRKVSAYQIKIIHPGRNVVTVEFDDAQDFQCALEGWLDVVKK